MILKRLRTIPDNLFEAVEFQMGANLIFGHKDPAIKKKNSLNGIGKSTFLDMIDFCLLGSYSKTNNNRLFLAKDILKEHLITLDFEVDGKPYSISRSIEKPAEIFFASGGKEVEMTIGDAKKRISQLVFLRSKYDGKFSDDWFRSMMCLFLKIHKSKSGDKFIDPIQYIDKVPLSELLQYHLFLLGIDNSLSYENNNIQNDIKRKKPALKEVRSIVEETYNVSDIKDANEQLLNLQSEIKRLDSAVNSFKLSENYKVSEGDVDSLTKDIKYLLMQNINDHKRLNEYQKSLETYDEFNKRDANSVSKIYKELNEVFSESVKVTLDAAVDFRKEIAKSRQEFIGDEITRLGSVTEKREQKIKELDDRRADILGFLRSKEAIKDLTEAFSVLSDKKNDMANLSAKLTTYNTIEKELVDIEAYEKTNDSKILSFIQTIRLTTISDLHDLFMEVYSTIYLKSTKPRFNIGDRMTTDAKIDIAVSIPADNSKANNQGRTLIYDLMLMLNMIKKGLRGPRFLIHDGVFDGMDKSHFVNLYKFLHEDARASKFQYIFTLNEEGELNKAFGATEEVSVERLRKEAILVLTPKKKLLGNFDKK